MNAIADSTPPVARHDACVQRMLFRIAFVALALLGIPVLLSHSGPNGGIWPAAAFAIIATLAAMIAQSRQLPVQNVLLAAGIIGGGAALSNALGFASLARTGNQQHWVVPFPWVAVLLNSRGVAKLIVRPWRNSQNYGFVILGLTLSIAVPLLLASSVLGAAATGGVTNLQTASATDLLVQISGCSLTAFVVLLLATPGLINKKPVNFAPNVQPLILWAFSMLVCATVEAMQSAWFAGIVEFAFAGAVALVAVRGATPGSKENV